MKSANKLERRLEGEVSMVDLTCRTPQYDRRLVEGLHAVGCPVKMWAAGCYGDDLYKSEFDIQAGCVDLMAHLPNISERLTKWLKAGEYLVNLLAFWRRLLRDTPSLVHFQWLPLLDVSTAERFVVDRIQRRGAKVVYTVHDLLPLDASGEMVREQKRRYSTVYQQVDALICHTNTSRTRLTEEFGVKE